MFSKELTIYDESRHQVSMFPDGGAFDAQPAEMSADDFDRSDGYVQLIQAAWAPATRATYHRWTLVFMRFAATFDKPILPVDCEVACRWLHVLCQKFAGKTVNVAICSIIALSALNDLPNPIQMHPQLRMAWRGVRRTRFVRSKEQKFPLDAQDVLKIWQYFLENILGNDDFVKHRSMAMQLTGLESASRVKELRFLTICNWHDVDDATVALQHLDTKANFMSALCFTRVGLARSAVPLARGPSAVRYIREVWMPMLARHGVRRHSRCTTVLHSTAPCRLCPRLFPTINSRAYTFGTVTAQHFTDEMRFYLARVGHTPASLKQYSGISLRRTAATLAAIMKADKAAIQYHMRHHSSMSDVYTELKECDRLQVSRAIHRALHQCQTQRTAKDNDDHCYVCGERGSLLCCDGCRHSAHQLCVGLFQLPSKGVPWYCTTCHARAVVLE